MDTVVNLKQVAHVMGQELDDQEQVLFQLDQHADSIGEKLTLNLKRLNGKNLLSDPHIYSLYSSKF